MAQKLFYVYRRELFDKNFISVAHKGRDMILYEDVHGYGQDLTPAKALEKSLVPFPDNLFTETQDREAVLAFRACSDAILLLHEPLSIILKGNSGKSLLKIMERLTRARDLRKHSEAYS